MAGAQQGIGRRGHLAVGVGEIGRSAVQIGTGRVGRQDLVGQRLQTAAPRDDGQRLLLGLVREVEILETLRRTHPADLLGELLGELPLRLDRAEDRLLPLGQHSHLDQPTLDLADLLLVQSARLIFAIPGDEGNRVALVQKLDHCLNLRQRNAKATGHVSQIDGYGIAHKWLTRVKS